ncbi:hypothetical protein [Psychrobacillus sp. NPDC093180]
MTENNKPILPIAKKITKMPKLSRLSRKNQEMLNKIERWKKTFG